MTRGISEESIKAIIEDWSPNDRVKVYDKIITQCTELNPWMPIESAPIGKVLRLYSDGTEPSFGKGQSTGKLYAESDRKYFSHWCELPDDPK